MLSLCMIVKDEEETLEECIKSVKGLVDEIVIVDTGSKDKSKEIALKYTDKVFEFTWCNDFSQARNFSISKASNSWVLVLDADEIIKDFNRKAIEKFCSFSDNTVGRIKRINIYEDQYGTKKYIERVNRLFNKEYFKYEGIIHEQVVTKEGITYDTENIDLCVEHIGYSKEVLKRTNKVRRNIELLKMSIEEKPNDPYLYYQLGKSYFMGKDFDNAYISFEKALPILDNFSYEYAEDLIESYGYSLININLFNKALDLYKYEQYYSKSPDFLFLLAIIEMNNGNFKKAVETFLKCIEFKEGKIEGITSFLPLYNIGVIFECLGSKDKALKYYEMCGDYVPAVDRIKNNIQITKFYYKEKLI